MKDLKESFIEKTLKSGKEHLKNRIGVNCQSCGMPIKKDKNKGTEKEGSLSQNYCFHCYEKGEFTQPNCTAQEMQEKVYEVLVQKRFPKFIARYFTRDIPKLGRWQD